MPRKVRTPPSNKTNIQSDSSAATATRAGRWATLYSRAVTLDSRVYFLLLGHVLVLIILPRRRKSLILLPPNVGTQRLLVNLYVIFHTGYQRAPLLNSLNFFSLSSMGQNKLVCNGSDEVKNCISHLSMN